MFKGSVRISKVMFHVQGRFVVQKHKEKVKQGSMFEASVGKRAG